jgi:hypothetical protein
MIEVMIICVVETGAPSAMPMRGGGEQGDHDFAHQAVPLDG